MCEYCKVKKNEIYGKNLDLQPTAGFQNDRVYRAWIMKNEEDEKAGIMITTDNGNGVYVDIDYCPICGRRLNNG